MVGWCTIVVSATVMLTGVLSVRSVNANPQTTPATVQTSNVALVDRSPDPGIIDVSKPYASHLQPMLQKIKATSEQRVKITQIVSGYRFKIQPLRDEYKLKRQEFINDMTSGASAESIMSKQFELSHLSSDITAKYTSMRIGIRRLLTPQQILIFEDYGRQRGWNH